MSEPISRHLSYEDLKRYRDRTMSSGESLAANDHLAACDLCYDRSGGNEDLNRAYDLVRRDLLSTDELPEAHLPLEQVMAYVDGKLDSDEQHAVRLHIEKCRGCETAVADLTSVSASLAAGESDLPYRKTGRFAGVAGPFARPQTLWWALGLATVALVASLAPWIATNSMRTEIQRQADLIREQQLARDQMQSKVEELRRENDALANGLEGSNAELAKARERLAKAGLTVPGTPVSILDGGRVIALDSDDRLTGLDSLSAGASELVRSALATGRLRTPDLTTLAGPQRSLMGGSPSVEYPLLGPFREVVTTDRPTLKWRPVEGATAYVAGVYDLALNEVVVSDRQEQTEWTVPRPLKRGRTYVWQLKVTRSGVVTRLPAAGAPDARFKVLEASRLDAIERARQGHGDSHLLMGVLYADAGLLADAEREIEQLAQANPRSEVAQRLLRGIKSARGKTNQ